MLTLRRTADRPTVDGLLSRLADMVEATCTPASAVVTFDEQDEPPLWTPFPGAQSLAYTSLADELFYGGAGGGGKSWLEIGLAVTAHHSSIIFRREYTQFAGPEGLIAQSRKIVGDRGRYSDGVWRDLPGDRSLEFGAMKNPDDWRKYAGRGHDLKAFDELPEFTEEQYRSAIGWLRTPIAGQRMRVVATGNPPTNAEGQWVIGYWGPWLDPRHPHPAKPGELRWFAVVDGKDVERPDGTPFTHTMVVDGVPRTETIQPRSRTFIPARVEDNPVYMATGYDQVLNSLPEPLRSQMRFGNFQATQTDNAWQVIPTAWVQAAQARWTEKPPQMPKPGGEPGELVDVPMSAVGADISRGGPDKTTLAVRRDAWYARVKKFPGTEVKDGQAAAQLLAREVGGDTDVPLHIDVLNIGASAFDQARDLKLNAFAMNASEGTKARDKSGKLGFVNKRAQWIWQLREALEPGSGQDLALPPDTELLADLCAARYRMTARGIQIELKEEIKKRIGRSPDVGEAVILASAQPAPKVTFGVPVSIDRSDASPWRR